MLVYAASDRSAGPETLESTLVAGQLRDDLTSLQPADQAGDPFTSLKTDESPSFSTDPKGAIERNTPESLLPIGPGDGLNSLADRRNFPSSSELEGVGMTKLEPSMPFSGRSKEMRAKIVSREGGTVESEHAVELGLHWLARHQRKDGSWGMDPRPQCREPGCSGGGGMNADVAATGLGLLPMLAAGHLSKGGALSGQRPARPGMAGRGPEARRLAGDRRGRRIAHVLARDRHHGALRGARHVA